MSNDKNPEQPEASSGLKRRDLLLSGSSLVAASALSAVPAGRTVTVRGRVRVHLMAEAQPGKTRDGRHDALLLRLERHGREHGRQGLQRCGL